MKNTTVRPLGLITQPNKYGVFPAGALSIAANVLMRDPGVLSSMPGQQVLYSAFASTGTSVRHVMAGSDYNLVVCEFGGLAVVRWVKSGANDTVGSFTLQSVDTGKVRSARFRDRYFLTLNRGVEVYDAEDDNTARRVGLRAPWRPVLSVSGTNAQSLADQKTRRYRCILRRVQSDGYTMVSRASNTAQITNNSGATVDPICTPLFGTVVAGDVLELYRTKDQDIGVDPGDVYYLAASRTLTSTDVSNGFYALRDVTVDSALGTVELYTNPGQEGPLANHTSAPLSDDIVHHAGYMFYLARRIAPTLNVRTNGKVGVLTGATENTYGLGTRETTGDFAVGTDTILNVADTTGLEIGQVVYSPGGSISGERITNIAGSTVTMDGNAGATAVGTAVFFYDVIELTGPANYISVANNYNVANEELVIAERGHAVTVSAGPAVAAEDVSAVDYTFRQLSYMDSTYAPFAIRATNGQNYTPPLPSTSETGLTGSYDERFNRWLISKYQQPDHMPFGGEGSSVLVGSGVNYRGVSVGGILLVFASDGLWQIDGPPWQTNRVDPTLILAARGCVGVMDETAYAYTNRGLVSVSPDGQVTELSSGTIGQAASSNEFAGASYADTWDRYLVCDELHHEVLVTLDGGARFTVYNTRTQAFTNYVPADAVKAADYSRQYESLLLATATSGGKSLETFVDDASDTRQNATVQFQPFTAPDPSHTCEWIDVEYAFEGFTSANATLTPLFNSVASSADITVIANTIESRAIVPVPRIVGLTARCAPGFYFSSGGTSYRWSLRMVSIAYRIAFEGSMSR